MRIVLMVWTTLLTMVGFTLSASAQNTIPELSSALSLFSAQATTAEGVRLNWILDHQSPTIFKFRVYRGYEEVGNFAVLAEISARSGADSMEYSYKDISARPQVSYYYKLAAVGQNSESVFPVVITACLLQTGSGHDTILPAATVLRGDAITLYVRKAGRVKLTSLSSGGKTLVDQEMQPGIYELQVPSGAQVPLTLRLEHSAGQTKEFRWPIE
jgi:hypothetical protein